MCAIITTMKPPEEPKKVETPIDWNARMKAVNAVKLTGDLIKDARALVKAKGGSVETLPPRDRRAFQISERNGIKIYIKGLSEEHAQAGGVRVIEIAQFQDVLRSKAREFVDFYHIK